MSFYVCVFSLFWNLFVFIQAIFMIPTNPPPTFRKPELWSDEFTDFVKKCLVKNPEQRATATQLLQVRKDRLNRQIKHLRAKREHNSMDLFPICLDTVSKCHHKTLFFCSCQCPAPIYQPGQASHNPERPYNWSHGDESQETAGAAERAGGRGWQLCTFAYTWTIKFAFKEPSDLTWHD